MRILLVILISLCTVISMAQEECQIAFVADHFIDNQSSESVIISVDIKNQESFPTEGPEVFTIDAGQKVKVADLEWAGEFKNPTEWFVFVPSKSLPLEINDSQNWKHTRTSEYKGAFTFTIKD